MKAKAILVALLLSSALQAQTKAEKEERVKASVVPALAREWLEDAYENDPRVKWYREVTSGHKSFEAKFRWKGHRHSVEFDTTGTIEDIEIEVSWKSLPAELRDSLQSYFSTYQKYQIRKIQRQLTGEPEDLEDAIDENEREGITVRYEIEFQGKTEDQNELWEGLFDEKGNLLRRRKIVLRPTDNFNY